MKNKDITYAVHLWKKNEYLSLEEMKELIGISIPTIRSYLNGSFTYIKPKSMDLLLPHIQKYMEKEIDCEAVAWDNTEAESLMKENHDLKVKIKKLEEFIIRMATS